MARFYCHRCSSRHLNMLNHLPCILRVVRSLYISFRSRSFTTRLRTKTLFLRWFTYKFVLYAIAGLLLWVSIVVYSVRNLLFLFLVSFTLFFSLSSVHSYLFCSLARTTNPLLVSFIIWCDYHPISNKYSKQLDTMLSYSVHRLRT